MEIIQTLIVLYTVNLIGDYPLQGPYLAEFKSKSNYLLWVHSAIWGGVMSIALMPLGIFAIWKAIMLIVGHFIIDYITCRMKKPNVAPNNNIMLIDQGSHILQMVLCLI